MKNFLTLLCVLAFFASQVAIGQETEGFSLKSKKGITILPEAGDIALGIDATPFLSYIGGFFSNSGAGAPFFAFTAQNPGAIYLKKFITDRKALRVAFRIGYSNVSTPIGIDPAVNQKVVQSAAYLRLQVGLENSWVYKSRVRGYYGAGIMISKSPYYGYSEHALENVTGTVSYKDADDPANDWKEKGGFEIGGGIGGIVGVDVFIAPKISLGGEFNIGLMVSKATDRIYAVEGEDDEYISLGGMSFGFDNVASGALVLLFYF
jgi:hypothetical protein